MAANPMNIMDVANYVQQQGVMGQQQGQTQRFNALAGQAYNAPAGADRSALVGQAVATDPRMGVQLGNVLASKDASAQAADTNHLQKVANAAKLMVQVYNGGKGDPAAIQGTWNNIAPYLGQVSGKTPPPQFDPSMLPAMYQAIAASGQTQDKGIVLGGGSQLRNPVTGELLADNPTVPNMQFQNVSTGQLDASGNPIMQQGGYNPRTGAFVPVQGPGQAGSTPAAEPPAPAPATQTDPMQPFIAQANEAIKMGADQGKVEAWLMQQAQQVGAQPQGGSMGPGDPTAGASAVPVGLNTTAAAPAPAQLGFGQSAKSAKASSAPSGYRMSADGKSMEAIPGGPADKTGASSVTLGDPQLSGQQFLASIPDPAMQKLVQAVADGRMPLPKIYRAGKAGEIGPTQIAQAVAQYDPTYDQADPNSRIKARGDFTSGKAALEIQRLNTLAGHLLGLADATDKLGNSGSSTDYNAIANNVVTRLGSKAVTNFNQAANPAAEEFAAIMKGTGAPTEQEIRLQQKSLDSSLTPEQLHGVIGTMAAQVQSRLEALHERAANGLGPFASKVNIITPEGRKALDGLRTRGFIPSFHIGENGQEAPQPTQQGPQAAAIDHSSLWGG